MTRLINQFDIKYIMAKRIVGRTQIEVIDSIPYSQLVFLVASGKSYALTIAEARGKKDSSPTAKQLKQLEARGFLKSQKEKLLNKTIYSVNWNKILDEFFLFLKERKEGFIDSHNRLKTNVSPEILERLKLLDNKDFVKDMKANKYLNQFLKEYLSSIRDRSCSLYEAFAYFLVYVSFDFIYSTNPNLYYILSLGEGTNSFKIEEKERKKEREKLLSTKTKEKWVEAKEKIKTISSLLDKKHQEIRDKIKRLSEEDRDLKNILFFEKIRNTLSSDLGLQIALNNATELTAFYLLKNHFSEERIKECAEKFLRASDRYKNVPQELIEEVKKKIEIENLPKNSFKVAKPTENRHKKSGNTTQNTALSSENKRGESSK